MAEERELQARRMARIAVGLFIVCNLLAATSFSAQSRYSDLCDYVGREAPVSGALNRSLLDEYCL